MYVDLDRNGEDRLSPARKDLLYRFQPTTGTKGSLVPVCNNNRYQRSLRAAKIMRAKAHSRPWAFGTGWWLEPVPKVFPILFFYFLYYYFYFDLYVLRFNAFCIIISVFPFIYYILDQSIIISILLFLYYYFFIIIIFLLYILI